MKKITRILTFLFTLFVMSHCFSQKVVIVGMNHLDPDGFSFVAAEDLLNGEIIYFTENEYSDVANAFNDQSEAVVVFTATSAITKGTVIYVAETAANVFSVSCTGGGACGTAVKTGTSGAFAIATDGDALYAYSDSDSNPTNGITEIYAVMYTGSAEILVTGGLLPVNENPVNDYPNAVVVHGFPSTPSPNRVEFTPTALARDGVSKVGLENPFNYVHAQSNAALSTLPFTDLNLGGANPVLTVTASPISVMENSGTPMVYTFLLSENAASNITVNFSVGGTATFGTDYTQTGASAFNATTGTVVITTGNNSATVSVTPVADTTLEANETIIITLTSGTGYDSGSPGSATTTILNDDQLAVTPLVAVTGLNHTATQAFSFVALQDIPAGTQVYFTENAFNTSLLTFSGAEAVVRWTAPAGGVDRGEVIVAKETSPDTFTTSCDSGNCGNVIIISGNFSLASNGEEFYAYVDSDSNPTNGIDRIHAVLFTGTTVTPGGTIPASQNPASVYTGAVVVDGFPGIAPNRTEYNPALRNVTVDQANFQNTANWLHAQANQDLSPIPFNNIIISDGSTNPSASVTVSPAQVMEDSGDALVYTFSLNSPASGNITINFSVSGTAGFPTDYSVTGENSFNAATGSIVILDGTTSSTLEVTPVADTDLEIQETVVLTITSGTGYDGGSPNSAAGTINNDDTSESDPIVAITGLSHAGPDGFSFVAAQDIPAGTEIYFTDNSFDATTLFFSSGEAVLKWTSPAAVIPKGDVIVVTETSPDAFSLDCNGTSGGACGSIVLISGSFTIATDGETFYAYEDTDDNPSNGVTDIYAVLYTGATGSPGGNIPASEDPSGIFLSALVVDGFPSTVPGRTEYDETKRGISVSEADFEDVSNWVHAQGTPPNLSPVPFANISILDSEPPVAVCQNITVQLDSNGSVTISGSLVDGGSTDNIGIVSYSLDIDTFTCANIGTPVTVTLTVFDAAGNSDSCTADVTVEDNENPDITCVGNQTVDTDAGVCTYTHSGIAWDAMAPDNCSTDTIEYVLTGATIGSGTTLDGVEFNLGVTTVMWTATDGNSNTDVCSFEVTVEDSVALAITCPGDMGGSAGSILLYTDHSITTNQLLQALNNGGYDVTFTDDDLVFQSEIIIPDAYEAVFYFAQSYIPNTTSVNLLANYAATGKKVFYFDWTRNNSLAALFGFSYTGTNNNTQITVTDPELAANLPSNPFTLINPGWGIFSTGMIPLGVNQTLATFSNGDAAIISNPDRTLFIYGYVNDAITFEDLFANNIEIIINQLNTDPGVCTYTHSGTNWDAAVTDNCSINTVEYELIGATTGSGTSLDGVVFNLGVTTVTWTATDENSNTDVCSFDVTVVDNENPEITCVGDQTVDVAVCTYTHSGTAWDAVADDNCSVATLEYELTGDTTGSGTSLDGVEFNLGVTTVTWTATDGSSNTDVCSFDVTVEDNENPEITCVVGNQTIGSVCSYTHTGTAWDATADDNCSVATLEYELTGATTGSGTSLGGVEFNSGVTTVTWTATDGSSNTDVCSFTVTVEETEAPDITCIGNQTPVPDANACIYTHSGTSWDAMATDNCGIDTLEFVLTGVTGGSGTTLDGVAFNFGITTVIWTATDHSGNTDTCSFTVYVYSLDCVPHKLIKISPDTTAEIIRIIISSEVVTNSVVLKDGSGNDTGIPLVNGQMDMSSLSAGIYFLTVDTDKGVINQTVVKM